MKFIFDLIFYPIVFVIIGLFLFYEPVATSIFLLVLFVICIMGTVLLYSYRKRR